MQGLVVSYQLQSGIQVRRILDGEFTRFYERLHDRSFIEGIHLLIHDEIRGRK